MISCFGGNVKVNPSKYIGYGNLLCPLSGDILPIHLLKSIRKKARGKTFFRGSRSETQVFPAK
jgi:hypothetical protein